MAEFSQNASLLQAALSSPQLHRNGYNILTASKNVSSNISSYHSGCLPAAGNSLKTPKSVPPGAENQHRDTSVFACGLSRELQIRIWFALSRESCKCLTSAVALGREPIPHVPSGHVLASSCEQPQPGIWKMAVRRVFGATASPRALLLNVGVDVSR